MPCTLSISPLLIPVTPLEIIRFLCNFRDLRPENVLLFLYIIMFSMPKLCLELFH